MIARGCVDTIGIVVTDSDVVPRLRAILDFIVQQLATLLNSVSFLNFFDFLLDFVKMFSKDLVGQRIQILLYAAVQRICLEQ